MENIKHLIETKLKQTYEDMIDDYGKNNIMGVAAIGMANYGFAETEDEIEIVGIYLPTFEEICNSTPEVIELGNGVKLVDIRLAYDATKRTLRFLEVIFSNYLMLNPIFEEVFKTNILNNRELIAKYNMYNRIKIAYTQAMAQIADNPFNAVRLSIAAEMYAAGESCYECFHFNKTYLNNYLWKIKRKELKVNEEEIKAQFEEILNKIPRDTNEEAVSIIKKGVVNIMTTSFRQNCTFIIEENMAKTNYTSKELEAIERLKKELVNGEGNITVSNIVAASGISRPVFKNLFTKLEKNKEATIINQGAKGTYIKFLN